MLDRPRSGERALLLHVGLNRPCFDDEIQEFRALAESAGAHVVAEVHARRDRPDPKFFIGSGKVDEVAAQARESQAELILVNQPLRPGQERNLELALKVRVLDRNGLILDIFAQRAATFEGKLQVELAQHEHLASRLVRGWTHLERQKGGIGLRGPGETQLETDRRLVSRRIRHLRERLERVERQRGESRKERLRAEVPTVALVGYTNAGKTTLFNALSGAHLLAKDQLFATLDPTIRRVPLNGGEDVLLVDTVGFVRDLPHELVAAFRATLTETREAALLLHVIDASDPHREDRQRQVEGVLKEIGAAEVPRLPVYNKIDKAGADFVRQPAGLQPNRYCVSAVTGAGLAELRAAIRERVSGERFVGELHLGPQQSRVRAKLFEWHAVRGETAGPDGGWTLAVELPAHRWRQLRDQEGLAAEGMELKA
ncbi:MAG TPA: ribosome rescue GTPase HflX [Gammaproteobacteria bacterium]|nr:ribosome rescue GTPase HflX [Gammaproteobacteria bacterium]